MLVRSDLQKRALRNLAFKAIKRFQARSAARLPIGEPISLFDAATIPRTVIPAEAEIQFFSKKGKRNVNHFVIFLPHAELGQKPLTFEYEPKTDQMIVSGLRKEGAAVAGRMMQAHRGLGQFA